MHPRTTADQLVHLAHHLSREDRALIEAVYERGMTAAAVARLTGSPQRTVQARVQRLIARMNSPLFRFVLLQRTRWPQQRKAIAEAVILRGRPFRCAAAELDVSLHAIRREVDRVRLLAEEASQHAPTGTSIAASRQIPERACA